MKPMTLIWMLVVIALLSFFGFNKIKESQECSVWHPENCDTSCSEDSDCKFGNCCTCISNADFCVMERGILMKEAAMTGCALSSCKCVDNKCENVIE